MNSRELFKKALQDKKLNIEAINPNEYGRIERAIEKLPNDVIISEWLHTQGLAQYEYHIHIGEVANNLEKLYALGIKGGNPKLLRLYSKRDLKDFIQEPSKA